MSCTQTVGQEEILAYWWARGEVRDEITMSITALPCHWHAGTTLQCGGVALCCKATCFKAHLMSEDWETARVSNCVCACSMSVCPWERETGTFYHLIAIQWWTNGHPGHAAWCRLYWLVYVSADRSIFQEKKIDLSETILPQAERKGALKGCHFLPSGRSPSFLSYVHFWSLLSRVAWGLRTCIEFLLGGPPKPNKILAFELDVHQPWMNHVPVENTLNPVLI